MRDFRLLVWLLIALLGYGPVARAEMDRQLAIADLSASAARIFRGHCVASDVGVIEVAGARIPATTYSFRVVEYLKGAGPATISFRQVGQPGGGARDLGRLAGLPVYAPGTEYVLFLLPESSAGLTSPAGAAQGAFVVSGQQVYGSIAGPGGTSRTAGRSAQTDTTSSLRLGSMPYAELRRAVLQQHEH